MATKKSRTADSPRVKIGHEITPSAAALLNLLADLQGAAGAIIIEAGIRAVYDSLPASQRDALGVLLRAKGLSIRDLRKLPAQNQTDDEPVEPPPNVAGQGVALADDRLAAFSRIHTRAAGPIDAALESLG